MKKHLIFLILLTVSVLSATAFADSHYAIMVDAGSSGSRLHVFEYEITLSVPVIKDIFSESVKPGLATFADHPDAAGLSLKQPLDDARQILKSKGVSLSLVPVSIFATAGMRSLPEDKQAIIYQHVTDYLQQSYPFSIAAVHTISGKMEGLYGWLDVNYLLGNFTTHQATVGSIDMGGASTQIAFSTEDQTHAEDEIAVTIDQQRYVIFSKSFLGLGQDQAREAMLANPAASSCYPEHYLFKGKEQGRFSSAQCQAVYADLLEQKQVSQQLIPLSGRRFIAYSGIYYTFDFFGVDKTPREAELETSLQNVCNNTWEQLKNNYPQVPEKYLAIYCANGIYFEQLLYKTYYLHDAELTVTNKLNQQEIDWTLGAMLYELVR
ncbi:MAG: hypothetical protein A3E83_05450 [Gammaproteobacteria bacterium RIFCSPHIGHO2_12_FULL_41_20]|nr:MAG: hypothetical protein A3E83_05450 [Gammaproteobacteria bacterium RIFCSPHIGHO2_12_FULL_41_20]